MIKPGDIVCLKRRWYHEGDPPFFIVIKRGTAEELLNSHTKIKMWLRLVSDAGVQYTIPEEYIEKLSIPDPQPDRS